LEEHVTSFIKLKNKLKQSAMLATCFHAGFLLDLFFDPEDLGDMFLRNIG
jgi:hypothetical protein